jgi:hypothetical protein
VTIGFEGDGANQPAIVQLAEERVSKPVIFDVNLKLQHP